MTYSEAGVDVDAAAELVERIKPLAASTHRAGAISCIGGFGGLFDLAAAGVQDPVLVASADGVGTKLRIAAETGCHDTIGIDLVAMCVNDVLVQGAQPLFFLDYLATGKLETKVALEVVAGIAEGCRAAGCVLIGGETAEMPGMYRSGSYDLAGFAVGAVSRAARLPRGDIEAGDVLLGLRSNGLHSNGFSLIRHILKQRRIDYGEQVPFGAGQSWGEELLKPTRIYVQSCLRMTERGMAKGFCHITGGGLLDNLPRILPAGLAAALDAEDWPDLPVFGWLREEGGVGPREMARTFNCGIGMVAVVDPLLADAAADLLNELGEDVHRIGKVRPVADGERVSISSLEAAWRN